MPLHCRKPPGPASAGRGVLCMLYPDDTSACASSRLPVPDAMVPAVRSPLRSAGMASTFHPPPIPAQRRAGHMSSHVRLFSVIIESTAGRSRAWSLQRVDDGTSPSPTPAVVHDRRPPLLLFGCTDSCPLSVRGRRPLTATVVPGASASPDEKGKQTEVH